MYNIIVKEDRYSPLSYISWGATCKTHLALYERERKHMSNYHEYYKSIFGTAIYSNTISIDDIYQGWRSIPINGSKFKTLKDLYHNMVSIFGLKALDIIKINGWFGRAYYNAYLYTSNGCNDNIYLPSARQIGIELKKLLTRAQYNGFVLDDNVE